MDSKTERYTADEVLIAEGEKLGVLQVLRDLYQDVFIKKNLQTVQEVQAAVEDHCRRAMDEFDQHKDRLELGITSNPVASEAEKQSIADAVTKRLQARKQKAAAIYTDNVAEYNRIDKEASRRGYLGQDADRYFELRDRIQKYEEEFDG